MMSAPVSACAELLGRVHRVVMFLHCKTFFQLHIFPVVLNKHPEEHSDEQKENSRKKPLLHRPTFFKIPLPQTSRNSRAEVRRASTRCACSRVSTVVVDQILLGHDVRQGVIHARIGASINIATDTMSVLFQTAGRLSNVGASLEIVEFSKPSFELVEVHGPTSTMAVNIDDGCVAPATATSPFRPLRSTSIVFGILHRNEIGSGNAHGDSLFFEVRNFIPETLNKYCLVSPVEGASRS